VVIIELLGDLRFHLLLKHVANKSSGRIVPAWKYAARLSVFQPLVIAPQDTGRFPAMGRAPRAGETTST
jgi:hypothetical protein